MAKSHRPRSAQPKQAQPQQTRSQRTRELLLQTTLAILREEGAQGVTTIRLAAAAGIAQSGFYRYFPTIEACLEAAIAPIAAGVREDIAQTRRALFTRFGVQTEPASIQAEALPSFVLLYQGLLDFARGQPALVDLLVRRRFEASPVGQVFGQLVAGLRSDLSADFEQILRTAGLTPRGGYCGLAADLLIGAVLAALEAQLDGQLPPRAAELLALLGHTSGQFLLSTLVPLP